MQTKIERIGDQFGLVLPKELLEACGFGTEATVTIQDNSLIVTPQPRRVREGWSEALARIPRAELERDFGDLAAFREAPDEWGASEWEWPDTQADEKI